MNRSPLPKRKIEKLYNSGLSMAAIASLLRCSIHKVAYWMNEHHLPRRSLSQAIYLKANPKGDPFKIKTNLSKQETFLFGLGLGIYWGEGDKTSKNAIRVANTNPTIIKMFIKFLLNICNLKEYKLLFQVICFNNSNPLQAKEYWANELEISAERFGKIIQIPTQGKGTYRKKSSYGVCILTVSNIKLKPWIMEELRKIEHLPL